MTLYSRHCGEHRIVYGKGDPENATDRFFLIFEAALDNPSFVDGDHDASREGCRPVAEFWDGLKDKTGPELAQALETFYYAGLDTDGDGRPDVPPVVHFRHYGVPFGQVRGNLFVTQGDPNANPWQLREWRVAIGADSAPSFAADTVKDNPFPPLYGAAATGEDEGIPALRAAFNDEFVATHAEQLVSLDRAASQAGGQAEDGNRLLLDLGAGFENRFNGFQSVSQRPQQGPGDDPLRRAEGTGLPDRIAGRLDELGVAGTCRLTREHVLNRAGALSCGGCHQFSAGRAVAPEVAWPPPAPGGFVHVTEQGVLSPALEDHFLPGRREKLEGFLAEAPAGTTAAAAATLEGAAKVAPPGVQQQLDRVRASETRLEAIEALRGLEAEVGPRASRTRRSRARSSPTAARTDPDPLPPVESLPWGAGRELAFARVPAAFWPDAGRMPARPDQLTCRPGGPWRAAGAETLGRTWVRAGTVMTRATASTTAAAARPGRRAPCRSVEHRVGAERVDVAMQPPAPSEQADPSAN